MNTTTVLIKTAGDIGPLVRTLRQQRGWTQDRLATESGCGKATVCQIETGVRSPTAWVLLALLRALGHDLAVL